MKEVATMRKKEMLKSLGSNIWNYIKAHQTTVLTGSTIACNAAGIVTTYKNSPKIHAIIDRTRMSLEDIEELDIPDEEKKVKRRHVVTSALKEAAPLIAPILIFFTGSTVSAIVNQKKSEAKIAALTAALSLAKTTIDEYGIFEDKVKEEIGEEQYEAVKNEITKKKIEETLPDTMSVAMGEYLCYIPEFGIYFSGTKDKINLAMERINNVLSDNGRSGRSYGYLSNAGNEIVFVTDLLDELDIFTRRPKMCDSLGWDAGNVREVKYWIGSGQTSTGVPYLTLEFGTRAEFINEY